jgi:F-type H+-transporting ATPase subunit b
MKNWESFLILANKANYIKLNSNIFETNLINIIILLIILFYVLESFLSENLSARQNQITNNIKNGEKRLEEAIERLEEVKSQWAQTNIILEEIELQTKQSKSNLFELEFNRTNEIVTQRFSNLLTLLYYREQEMLISIITQVFESALKQVVNKLTTSLVDEDQYAIINNKINRLEGHL